MASPLPTLGHLVVKNARGKGRGVFTTKAIKKGAIVEICPTVPLSIKDGKKVMETILGHYAFEWGKNGREAAIALGYGSIYNHSATPNITYDHKEKKNQIVFTAIRNIRAGEELLSNYHNDEDHYRKPFDEWLGGKQIYQ